MGKCIVTLFLLNDLVFLCHDVKGHSHNLRVHAYFADRHSVIKLTESSSAIHIMHGSCIV